MAKKAVIKEKDSAEAEIIKKFKQNPGVYIGSVVVLVLVVITFVGGDFLSGGRRYAGKSTDLTFGYYDKIPITWVPGNELSRYYETTVNYARSQGFNPNDPNDSRTPYINYSIWRQAFDRTVRHVAIIDMLKRSGYTVSEKAVNKVILQLPQFQENGRFSLALYNRIPESSRADFWHSTQDDIAMNVFFSDYLSLLIPEAEAKFIANMSSPVRSFDFVSFSVDDYPESEFLAYGRENIKIFGTIQLSKITISGSEKEAKKILASVKDGTTTFEDAAKAQSKDMYADRGGDMGVRYCYEIDGEITASEDRDAIYKLGKGELSDVVSTGDGWAFFRVEEALIEADLTDWSTLNAVRAYVRDKEMGRMEDWAVEQANKFISEAKESGYANAARLRNLVRNNFGPVPLNFGSVDLFTTLDSLTVNGLSADDLKALSQNENFWRITFTTPVNTPGKPLVQGSNVFVFVPTEENKADEASIDELASSYKTQYLQYTFDKSLQDYFMNDGKLKDNFNDIYFKYLAR
jgi:peptidyl-prolyl cis-trans isomerase D